MNKRIILSVLITLLVILSTVISKWIFQIPMVGVVTIIEIGLYGISVSVVCYRFLMKSTEKTMMKDTGIVFLLTILMGIHIRFLAMIMFFLGLVPRVGLYILNSIIYAIGINAYTGFLQGLFVSMVISIATFILIKFDIKKSILPIEENKWNS